MTKTYGPYSPYQTTEDLIFTAGHVGAVDGKAHNDISRQTKTALDNLSETLSSARSSLKQVLKTTVYLVDMGDFEAMNKVYAQVFSSLDCKPARSTIAVKELPRIADSPLLIEIEAVAHRTRS